MPQSRDYCLSLAGFDPSSAAGLTSDIKTFENNGVYGLGVCSALTIQNDVKFQSVQWIPFEYIQKQFDILYERFHFQWVKIGLIENFDVLSAIISYLISKNNSIKIIWDPIIKASSGFEFHKQTTENEVIELCKKIHLITPNYEEIKFLFQTNNETESALYISKYCSVLLKGGHRNDEKKATDILFFNDQKFEFQGEYDSNLKKHGSGCVLSSAILSNLARGFSLPEACFNSKSYMNKFLKSNTSLLGYHSNVS
jgi:hydroxymethylpyrimidine/phosphomethylpyrimidine kinase